jgi:hypothetical protein
MADIDVVPKPKSNVWLWYILAAIVVAVILFMLLGGRSDASRAVGEWLDNAAFVVVLSSIA